MRINYRNFPLKELCHRLNEADYVTIGNIKLPTDMTGMADNTSYQDATKLGQKLYDKEQARLARVADEKTGAALYTQCDNAIKSSSDNVEDKLSALFEILVPPSGKCDTVAGEIVRAAMRILYRWFNDGDIFFIGDGFETAAPAAQYLMDHVRTVKTDLLDIVDHEDEYPSYEHDLLDVIDKVINYVMMNPRLFGMNNTVDSTSVSVTSFEEATFSYEVDVSGEDLDMLMDAGIISWNDVCDFLDDTIRYNSVFDGAQINQWAADAFTIDNLTKDGLEELEDHMDKWLADWCEELIEENQDMLDDDDMSDDDMFDENLSRYSRKRRITEAERKKYAFGTLVANHMEEIKSLTNKNELIDFVSGLKDQVSDETYLIREVIPNLQRKNFVAGLQYIINIALKGEKKGSIEKEFGRGSNKRTSRRRVNEARKLTPEQYSRRIASIKHVEQLHDVANDLQMDYPQSRLTHFIVMLDEMFNNTLYGENGPFSENGFCYMDDDLYDMLNDSLGLDVDFYTHRMESIYERNLDEEDIEDEVIYTLEGFWSVIKYRIMYWADLLNDDM